MTRSHIILLIIMTALIGVFFYSDLQQLLTLDALKARHQALLDYTNAHPVKATAFYALIYIAITALSLPGAALLTIAGGAIFGLLWGTLIVSFASTIGATLAFLAARFLFRDLVKARFADRVKAVDEGVARDGAYYLFTLRLVPIFPFFVINLVMGLTAITTRTFYWISQLGMLPGTAVYINAGTQLARIDTLSGIFSPALIGSFALLGFFPLLARKTVSAIQANKIYKKWTKPEKFDTNLVVIGAGAAGLVAAYVAAAVKAKVTLVEKHKMGGECLNTGCMPSKAFIRSTKLLAQFHSAAEFGLSGIKADFDFAGIMERVQRVIEAVAPHDSAQRYRELGVEVIEGTARIVSPWAVEVTAGQGSRTLTTRSIIIAAGSRPFIPAIPGLENIDYLTSDTVWNLRDQPGRLLVLGGGPVGCELAQAFARLGTQVIQVEKAPRLLTREDAEVSATIAEKFIQEGIDVRLGHTAKQFLIENGEHILIADYQGQEKRIAFDKLLLAIGRSANVSGFGLEEIGVELSPGHTVQVDEFQATNYPNIFACGDAAGPYQFTHVAAHQAWHASVNALFGSFNKFRTDYSVIPWATFTDPEIARAGLNEQDASEQGIAYEVSVYNVDDLDRAIADSAAHGFVKVLTPPGRDKILGVTIVGQHAGDIIAEFVLAMKHGIGLNDILRTIHIYPTMAEANKNAAGVWRRHHQPELLLKWIARFHAWRRG
jgi:pyruvate/2-oxoglutarate dehydrogenase complex dihydrolipoamide dehydrogenase (E3) component/uncharacterized membrane protein YdjX (TVP38/TMEM64 family)